MAIVEVSDADFQKAVPSSGMALVDFTATWCPPCRTLIPILEELEAELGGRVPFLKVDADHSPQTAAAYGVMSMPTVIVFRDGEPVTKLVGLRSKEAYRTALGR